MFRLFSKRRRPAQGTLAADLRAARKSGVRTAILVTLLVSGVTPALCLLWRTGDNQLPFIVHLKTMMAVTLQSYPLTLAVAIIVVSRRHNWFYLRIGRWCFAGSVLVFSAAISNVASQLTGARFIAPAQLMQDHPNSPWGILAAVVNTICGFYQTYGFGMFAASLLIGSYAGYWASRFLSHVPRSKSQVTGMTLNLIETQNESA